MATFFTTIRMAIGAMALVCIMAVATPVSAQQRNIDSSVNPTASSVKEEQLLQQLRAVQGRVTIPDRKEGVLIQPAGQNWRQFQQVTLHWTGAIVILGMLAVLILYYLIKGTIRIRDGRSGRTVVRFNAFERFVHWMTATCFVILALSGLNITFGKLLVLPLIGEQAFHVVSQFAKYAHNYLSFPFTIGVVLIFLIWIARNIPSRLDIEWLRRGGGLIGNDHPPARHFNAGQKLIYWIVVLGGAAVAITGYMLMFPFYGDLTVAGMQTAQMVHSIVAVLFVAVMLAHIYIGSLGMEGAFEAMGTGTVDVNWARQHHSLWLDEELARGREAPAGARATPAE